MNIALDRIPAYLACFFMVAVLFCLIFAKRYDTGQAVDCPGMVNGTAELVGYRVAKSSRLYFLDPVTGKVHVVYGLGGRREPSIELGQSINVQYCEDHLVFNKYDYVRKPENRRSRFVSSPGYKHLFP